MRRSAFAVLTTATATFVGLLVGPVTAAQAAPSANGLAHRAVHSCAVAKAGQARCGALVLVPASAAASPDKPGHGRPKPPPPPPSAPTDGYFPVDLQAAYHLTGLNSGGATVAIVDAYDDPTAEADLAVYRSQFHLPACTTKSGCFTKVGQTGGRVPRANAGWAQEISLDLDMVSAICPDCNILLVEAKSASFTNLGAAVNYAASVPGVVAISNSYGGSDSTQMSAYNHPGIAITASTGDEGYGVESPASFDSVIAVGGTSLKASGSGYTETAWSGAGSGCSTLNDRPSWQSTATECSGKANADVSAVADPQTGVAVYDSTAAQGVSGWLVFGGTSVSSPIIASVFALAGNTGVGTSEDYPAAYLWSNTSHLNDVTSGSNGSCIPTLWCHAVSGWDGPTGLGTPNGTGAF